MQIEDYKWFLENYNILYQEYGECYLAIKNQKIIGVFDSYVSGVKEISQVEQLGTFIIQHCNGNESGYTNYIATVGLIV